MQKDKILTKIEEMTEEMLSKNNLKNCYADATNISVDLKADRSNISRKLNNLFRLNYLIKINGRPTLYFSRRILEETTKISYIPANFNDIDEFEYFLHNDSSTKKRKSDWSVSKKNIIGSGKNEALANIFKMFQLLLHYPNHQFNLLIEGKAATGKSYLLSSLESWSNSNSKFSKNVEFIHLDSYSNDECKLKRIVESIVLTSKDKIHLIIIKNIHFLAERELEYFTHLLFETQKSSKYKLQFIFSSEPLKNEQKQIIENYLTNYVYLPNFDDRTLKEKMLFILMFLQRECDLLNRSFCISKNILTCLLISRYKNNLTEVKNEIMTACSNAYYRSVESPSNTNITDFQFSDLSDELLNHIPDVTGEVDSVKKIFEIIGENDLYFLVNIPQQAITLLQATSIDSNFILISNHINEVKISELVQSTLRANERRDKQTRKMVDDHLFEFINNKLIDFSLHIEMRNLQLLVQSIRNQMNGRSYKGYIYDLQKNNTTIVKIANDITDYIKKNDSAMNTEFMNAYIYSFLSMTNKQALDHVAIVFISQMENISNSYQAFFQSKYPQLNFISLYMKNSYRDLNRGNIDIYQQEILAQYKATKTIIITDIELLNQSGIQLFNRLPGLQIHYPLSINTVNDVSKLLINSTKETINKEEITQQSLTNSVMLDYLDKTLVFLNPKKAYTLLTEILENICHKLDIEITDGLKLHFVNHTSFMIERTIRNETLPYKRKKMIDEQYSKIFKIVEKELSTLNNIFAVNIPQNEILFTSEIFQKLY